MTTPLLPQAFWFRLAVPCRRIEIDGLPRNPGPRGRLLDLPADCALPATTLLEGTEPWADVRVAWNPAGLAVSVDATGSTSPVAFDDRPEGAYGLQLWIDTRDTRQIARATRFCQRFAARLVPAAPGARTALGVEVGQRPIARALADPPPVRPEKIASRAERLRGGWRIELFLPAESLHGYDPETNRRLGFAYQVSDPDRPDQFLGVGREFPVGENPSLWSTLELRDETPR
jgi:hypothetical protein